MELLIARDAQRARRRHPRRGGCTSGRSTCRPATCPARRSPGSPTIPTCSSGWRTRWPRRSGWRRASCCSTFRRGRPCSAWTCRSAPAAARSSGSPTPAARASSACRAWPTSSIAARGVSASSWPRRRERPLDGILDLLTCPPPRCARRLADEESLLRMRRLTMISRRAFLAQAAGLAAARSPASRRSGPAVPAAAPTPITVYKSSTCGCCAKWVDHLRANGFAPDGARRRGHGRDQGRAWACRRASARATPPWSTSI